MEDICIVVNSVFVVIMLIGFIAIIFHNKKVFYDSMKIPSYNIEDIDEIKDLNQKLAKRVEGLEKQNIDMLNKLNYFSAILEKEQKQ